MRVVEGVGHEAEFDEARDLGKAFFELHDRRQEQGNKTAAQEHSKIVAVIIDGRQSQQAIVQKHPHRLVHALGRLDDDRIGRHDRAAGVLICIRHGHSGEAPRRVSTASLTLYRLRDERPLSQGR
jgi:hypothetical protein